MTWTIKQIELLRQNWYTATKEELETMFERDFKNIYNEAIRRGLYGRNEKKIVTHEETQEALKRPPAVYCNVNHRQQLLDKYAPVSNRHTW